MKTVVFQLISNINDGGAESIVKDYALHIDRDKFDVVIVTIWPPHIESGNYKKIVDAKVPIISVYKSHPVFNSWILQKIWNRLFDGLYVKHRLTKFIKYYQPRAIHVHLEILDYVASLKKSLNGIFLFYTCHSSPERYFNLSNRKKELFAAKYLFRHHQLRMIALHNNMRLEINKIFNVDNTLVLPNGVDFERFKINESKELIRNSLGIPKDSFVIGHVGRFSSMKNHDFLVDIFHEMIKMNPKTFLLMIGDGIKKDEIIHRLSDYNLSEKYMILSHRSDVPRLLKSMDVFVFPSFFEGLPVSVVEAQVANLRCVVSDVITDECFFNSNLIPISLSKTAYEWATIALNFKMSSSQSRDINEFNIDNVIKRVEDLYMYNNE